MRHISENVKGISGPVALNMKVILLELVLCWQNHLIQLFVTIVKRKVTLCQKQIFPAQAVHQTSWNLSSWKLCSSPNINLIQGRLHLSCPVYSVSLNLCVYFQVHFMFLVLAFYCLILIYSVKPFYFSPFSYLPIYIL